MEITLLALCLMCFSTAASDSQSICELKNIYQDEKASTQVDGVSEGCWTSFHTKDGYEVHILDLQFSSYLEYPILKLTAAVPSIIVITSSTPKNFKNIFLQTIGNTTFYVSSEISMLRLKYEPVPPVKGSGLVFWVNEKFGGVTSYTAIQDPSNITFRGKTGTSLPLACQFSLEALKEKSLLHVQSEKELVKSCLIGSSSEEIYIINIPDHVNVKNVSVDVGLSKTKLVLRGPVGTHWKINAQTLNLLSNNPTQLNGMVIPPIKNISDSAKEIKELALDYYKVKGIAITYTEIHLNSPSIKLKIRSREHSPVTERPVEPTTTSPPISMQLFTSPDYISQLDLSSKVQTNRKIYAQVSIKVHGFLNLNPKVSGCVVRSSDSQVVERMLSYKQEQCLPKLCSNKARISFTLDTIKDLPDGTWELDCGVIFCLSYNCTAPQTVKRKMQVVQSSGVIPNPCFEFSLSSVLGIAFGGFLIGVLLVSALWFIKIRTAYEEGVHKGGASDPNKPRDDLPLEIR
ncbi:endoglin isoform X2 [Brachyhypopomus gauderio]|uniref:endoglin isoform X2 n=1 Tax=Brachyhypopomus gauderio TaxID=698409 RepID=UPI004041C67B